MAAASLSVDTPSPIPLTKESNTSLMAYSPSPLFSPASDKRFWSIIRGRNPRESNRDKRLKEDSLLLLRGFDSISHTLSQLSNNLDNALQGAKELSKPPTLTDIFHSNLKNSEPKVEEFEVGEESRSLAISMATKANSLARELKSIKNDLCFMQERCCLLEEENRRLREGFTKGIRPEEDDLVRLQLEALLAEKSRLANENANLVRENQCLHQLVEYHQMTSQDLSASYEEVLRGISLDFSSPIAEEEEINGSDDEADKYHQILGLSTSLDEYFDEEQQHRVSCKPEK
ncbi:Detected protein of unknown function [Hibiscus syriacus]|uniref:Uncharacterized protein n=1 Tax=Hibiscus syriacus TaxID=106335 RepID=A0A6A3BVB0_HIBSY|nr:Detected protein of unknown function [Hibiscus syriacus]